MNLKIFIKNKYVFNSLKWENFNNSILINSTYSGFLFTIQIFINNENKSRIVVFNSLNYKKNELYNEYFYTTFKLLIFMSLFYMVLTKVELLIFTIFFKKKQ